MTNAARLYFKNAVAIGDHKNAALYFDAIVPVFRTTDFIDLVNGGFHKGLHPQDGFLGELHPKELISEHYADSIAEVNRRGYLVFVKLAIQHFGKEPRMKGLTSEELDRVEQDFVEAYFSFIHDFGLTDWPLATEAGPATAGMPEDELQEASPILTLSRLQLIDASNVSWEHIAELRKDPIACERLLRLRLFAYENYSGKSKAFVEDNLLCRVSEYEASSKEWGLETVQGTLSLVLNSKLAAGALAGSFVSALFGQPVTALVAGATGAALEITGVALELQKRRLGFQSLARENPASYISYVKKSIDDAKPQAS